MITDMFNAVNKYPPLDSDEQEKLFKKIEHASGAEQQRAKDKLIKHHIWLVCYMVQHYFKDEAKYSICDKQDMVQEGMKAIVDKALPKFDRNKGYKFSTYARWWVFDHLNRLARRMSPIKVPKKIRRIRRDLEELRKGQSQDESHSYKELAKEVGESINTIKRAENVPDVGYLHKGLDGEEEALTQYIEDSNSLKFVDEVLTDELKSLLEDIFESLDSRDRKVLKYRFGLGEDDKRTLRDIGQELDLSRERIRQIQNSALKKVKRMAPESLKLFLEQQENKHKLGGGDNETRR